MNKLLLVDGSALLHRAYHAYPPLKSKTGEIVGAVYGVTSILISALESEKPSHVMVAWDLPKPTFRHIKYVGYKAQRPKADVEMIEQVPMVKQVIKTMGILQVAVEGYEADDVIGTLSTKFSNPKFSNSPIGMEVIILTGDQDTMQLVNEKVRILTPAKNGNPPVLYGPLEVVAKYGVTPDKIVDYKALIGDPGDNIPGVAGIGPKSAATLINQFGTLEAIYDAMENESQILNSPILKYKDKLLQGKESAFLSQDLSRIVVDMDIKDAEMEGMEYKGLQGQALKEKFEELGFKSLVKRFFGDQEEKKKKNENQIGLF